MGYDVISNIDADTLRKKYISFFEQRGHAAIPSASLIPENDPSVLFTTAGMHPLVPYLLGQPHPAGTRLVNCQKCIRTSDIEEVGDATHLTFFEMLGNWSLGDYFKQDSIKWSFDFLTTGEGLNIPKDRIWATCFIGNDNAPKDEEAAKIWMDMGLPEDRIVFLNEDNWWSTGSDGPCGPDTEIFIDTTGAPAANGSDTAPGGASKRFFEIWNNVFMCYNLKDGKCTELPSQNVDTGMGLERTLAVLNACPTVFETSSFIPIVNALISVSSVTADDIAGNNKQTRAIRILSDHLRTSVFIIGDENSVIPSNQGQGYVLRRLIRRAIRYCETLDIKPQQWVAAAESVIDTYGKAYPELERGKDAIFKELNMERERFEKVLTKGTVLLNREIEKLNQNNDKQLTGKIAFQLYDTYGFPIEFTEEIAAEQGLNVDKKGFEECFARHRDVSKTESAKSGLAEQSEEVTRYHTATHLLHAALRKVLGDHVYQKGSNITRDRLRFDFAHPAPMTSEEKTEVEAMVQGWIDSGFPVTCETMTFDAAKASNAIGLFADRYDGDVSVYTIDNVSKEICTGPHVENTSEIGKFKIKKEQSSSAGVRRIRAILS